MKKDIFSCDLCRRELPAAQLHGIYWQGTGGGADGRTALGKPRFRPVPPADANTHLCVACVQDIKEVRFEEKP